MNETLLLCVVVFVLASLGAMLLAMAVNIAFETWRDWNRFK